MSETPIPLSTQTSSVFLNDLGISFSYPPEVGVWRVNSQVINDNTSSETDEDIPGQKLNGASQLLKVLHEIDIMPFDKTPIRYSSNKWDFSKYTTLNINKKAFKFNFELCPEVFRMTLKDFIIIKLLENKEKIQGIHKKFLQNSAFFRHCEENGFFNVEDITDAEIKDFLNTTKEKSIETRRAYRMCIKSFFITYSAIFNDILTKDRLKLFEHPESSALYQSYKEESKFEDIPKDYFNQFVSKMVQISNDENALRHDRNVASAYVIISQTGLRIGEFLGLRDNCLSKMIIDSNITAYFLRFQTWKRESGNNTATWQICYANELVQNAVNVLISINKDRREIFGVDYLYMGGKQPTKRSFPIDDNGFSKSVEGLFKRIENFDCIDLPESETPGFRRVPIVKTEKDPATGKKIQVPTGHVLVFPHNHQFRVRVCTQLIDNGVPIKYVQKFMTHLNSEMTESYYRSDKKLQEEKRKAAEKTMRLMIEGSTKPIGPAGEKLIHDIDEFIKKRKFNIAVDIDEILAQIEEDMVINPKTGGLCIKSSLLKCSVEGRSNEYYCAYDVCPNLYYFFYMADVAYRQCQELDELIRINTDRGFLREAQKQCNMLRTIAGSKLIPELNELSAVIEKKGLEYILQNYPDLSDIITNYETVHKEAETWKLKTM